MSRVQELADEVVAKDMIIDSLRDHLARHQVLFTHDSRTIHSLSTQDTGDVQGADEEQQDESEESVGPGSDEEQDEEEVRQAEKLANDAMNMALLEV